MYPKTYNGFIINPTEEVRPSVKISPFRDKYISLWRKGRASEGLDFLNSKFSNPTLHLKARYAIISVLKSLKLKPSDTVTILTTSGNTYISSCVTNAISEVCKWNRNICKETSAIFVNHEFGYEYKGLRSLRSLDIPIIEDCAHIFSHSETTGNVGDYVIYSLPKVFPMQIGSIVNRNNHELELSDDIDSNSKEYILKSLSLFLPSSEKQTLETLSNYEIIKAKLLSLGLSPYFGTHEHGVPNVYMFKSENDLDLNALKIFMQYNGVECSVFYGTDAFFIPSNWGVNRGEIDYMTTLLEYFIKNLNAKNDY